MQSALPFIAHVTVFLVGASFIALGVLMLFRDFAFIKGGVARLIASPFLIASGLWFLYKVFSRV